MSPRRNRPRPRGRQRAAPDEPERPLVPDLVTGAPHGWHARAIPATRALKEYRCPGCDLEIRTGTAHVVAWREGDEQGRRHWHKGCWETQRRSLR